MIKNDKNIQVYPRNLRQVPFLIEMSYSLPEEESFDQSPESEKDSTLGLLNSWVTSNLNNSRITDRPFYAVQQDNIENI